MWYLSQQPLRAAVLWEVKNSRVRSGSGPLIITFRDPFENKLGNLSSLLLAKNSKNRTGWLRQKCVYLMFVRIAAQETQIQEAFKLSSTWLQHGEIYKRKKLQRYINLLWRIRIVCILMADACWCMAVTNTILKSSYLSIKNKFKKELEL